MYNVAGWLGIVMVMVVVVVWRLGLGGYHLDTPGRDSDCAALPSARVKLTAIISQCIFHTVFACNSLTVKLHKLRVDGQIRMRPSTIRTAPGAFPDALQATLGATWDILGPPVFGWDSFWLYVGSSWLSL